MPTRPDCCCKPSLRSVRVLDEVVCGNVVLQRCETCQTYWLAAHGHVELADGLDAELDGLQRLNGSEVAELMVEFA
jgi:hypothetical protein